MFVIYIVLDSFWYWVYLFLILICVEKKGLLIICFIRIFFLYYFLLYCEILYCWILKEGGIFLFKLGCFVILSDRFNDLLLVRLWVMEFWDEFNGRICIIFWSLLLFVFKVFILFWKNKYYLFILYSMNYNLIYFFC